MSAVHELSFEFDRRFIRDGLERDVAWRTLGFTLVLVGVAIVAIAVYGAHRQSLIILGAGIAALLTRVTRCTSCSITAPADTSGAT